MSSATPPDTHITNPLGIGNVYIKVFRLAPMHPDFAFQIENNKNCLKLRVTLWFFCTCVTATHYFLTFFEVLDFLQQEILVGLITDQKGFSLRKDIKRLLLKVENAAKVTIPRSTQRSWYWYFKMRSDPVKSSEMNVSFLVGNECLIS